ncbi:VOC family protein [Mesorhizobium sp. CA8]|uniref:VOC family protein n=1 Tax=Mesorhizobium sp. CA8 TaxID=2876637 RepID=UPI001CCEB34F|nr:VOC family protein [Mesorhizobium sp. CA8]MBZ9764312.1 VOC family protein [Mesorhizobium sp. CA8]
MAMNAATLRVERLIRFSLTTADAESASRFYEAAFGCRRTAVDRLAGEAFERLMGVSGGADRITLRLGRETLELLQFDVSGSPYPRQASSTDLFFQHFAIVTLDMEGAFERLSSVAGWKPISVGGPQHLPASSGGVTAFKFRDPEGHPLELLAFPKGGDPRWSKPPSGEPCLGIDHSAISVSDTGRSVAFYEGLGLSASAHSLNHGVVQEMLDDVDGAEVDVTALAPSYGTPHLELLCYRNKRGRDEYVIPAPRNNDIACTRLVFELAPVQARNDGERLVRDPDGHAFLLVSRASPRWAASGDAERSRGLEPTSPIRQARAVKSARPDIVLRPIVGSAKRTRDAGVFMERP